MRHSGLTSFAIFQILHYKNINLYSRVGLDSDLLSKFTLNTFVECEAKFLQYQFVSRNRSVFALEDEVSLGLWLTKASTPELRYDPIHKPWSHGFWIAANWHLICNLSNWWTEHIIVVITIWKLSSKCSDHRVVLIASLLKSSLQLSILKVKTYRKV